MTTVNSTECTFCGKVIDRADKESAFSEAGAWLAEHYWRDNGTVCCLCLENRGRLAMMYLNEADF